MNCRVSGSAHRCANNKLGCGGFLIRVLNRLTSVANCAGVLGRAGPYHGGDRGLPASAGTGNGVILPYLPPSTLLRFRFGSCDCRHKLPFETPSFFGRRVIVGRPGQRCPKNTLRLRFFTYPYGLFKKNHPCASLTRRTAHDPRR
jgi:hypothetical protein